MLEPLLKFVSEPYAPETLDSLMNHFRERGFVILPQVFQRESVDDFALQIKESLVFNGLEWTLPESSPLVIWSARAPRLRQALIPALSHSKANPLPSLYMNRWLIQTPENADSVSEWHKDREPEGMPGKEYHYPKDVFAGMYYEDITAETGPTRIIPGSHRDPALLPNVAPETMICCQKEEVLLLDQRTWHCGTKRKVPGTRLLSVYGFYPVPLHYSFCFRMPESQKLAWTQAVSRADRVFFGGPFLPPIEIKPTKYAKTPSP